jgi:hypothetical protein
MRLVAQGLTNQQVADELGLSVNTVGTHLKAAYRKLGACNRIQAVYRYGGGAAPTPAGVQWLVLATLPRFCPLCKAKDSEPRGKVSAQLVGSGCVVEVDCPLCTSPHQLLELVGDRHGQET